MSTDATPFVLSSLTAAGVPFHHDAPKVDEVRRLQWEAVRLWYEHDWTKLEPKLRTAIAEGVSVFLSMFDSDPGLRYTFCPPKECYERAADDDRESGVLPSFAALIERGYVCALNFPVAANPATAKLLGSMCKMDFHRAVLARIPRMSAEPGRVWRDVLWLCDECQTFITAGETHPGGDEQFLALARQARLIPILATQSVSSLRSTLPGETWRRVLQELRTKIFLCQSDDFSARYASRLSGDTYKLMPSFNVSETSRDAGISWLTGRTVGESSSVGTTTVYNWQRAPVFESKVFTELKNMEAIAFTYDGVNPLPAQRLYLKPHYLPVEQTHFEQLAAEAL